MLYIKELLLVDQNAFRSSSFEKLKNKDFCETSSVKTIDNIKDSVPPFTSIVEK